MEWGGSLDREVRPLSFLSPFFLRLSFFSLSFLDAFRRQCSHRSTQLCQCPTRSGSLHAGRKRRRELRGPGRRNRWGGGKRG